MRRIVKNCGKCQAEMDDDETSCPQCGHDPSPDGPLQMHYLPEQLVELGLSPAFAKFAYSRRKPAAFDSFCQPKEYGGGRFIPDDVSLIYPLWTRHSNVTCVWVRDGQTEFVHLMHDDEEITVLGPTEQHVLADLFRQMVEAAIDKDRPVDLDSWQPLADAAGFGHMKALLDWFAAAPPSDADERWNAFLQSIGDG